MKKICSYEEIINTELLESLHKTVLALKIKFANCDKFNNLNEKCLSELYDENGERLKQAVYQFIDLQLKLYKDFVINDAEMYCVSQLMY